MTIIGFIINNSAHFLPKFHPSVMPVLIIASILLILIGIYFDSVAQHIHKSRCDKCGKHFALKEIGAPKAVETKTARGTYILDTHYYKCTKCGTLQSRASEELISK